MASNKKIQARMTSTPQITVPQSQRQTLRGQALVEFLRAQLAEAESETADSPALDGGAETASIQVWVQAIEAGDDQRLSQIGLAPQRDLWQLRVDLPCLLPDSYAPVATRTFAPSDLDDFLRVNRAAFAWHPEQGLLDAEKFGELTRQPWYDPQGFLILELDGQLAGFCWTKVHAEHSPPLGEIFAIAVAPEFSGRGLGAPLTHAGLDFLAQAGLRTGMLYVEADNSPAQKIYANLGFELHQVNRVYCAPPPRPSRPGQLP